MKYTKHIPAILLGVLFVVFGANYFLNFIPNPPMTGKPLEFMNLFGQTGYMGFVKVVEIICGVLLLIPKTRALGLLLIAPIVVNILCFGLFIANDWPFALALLLLNAFGIYLNREKYMSIIS